MKKIVAMVLCLVMVAGLMTGCQKAMDAQTLTQRMDEAMKTVTAQGMDAELAMELKLSTMGVTMNIGLDAAMSILAKADMSAMYMDMSMTMSAMGETHELTMEMYGGMEDDSMVTYSYDSSTELWTRSAEDGYGELLGQLTQQTMSQLPQESLTLAEEQITVNDRKCYVLTADINGAYVQEYLAGYMDDVMTEMFGSGELDEESVEQVDKLMESLDWSCLSARTVYHVDAETFLPLEMSVELQGLGDVFNGAIEALMGEAMMEMDQENPAFAIDIPAFTMTMKNVTYNEAVQVPAVPQEVIDNAVDAGELWGYEDYEDYEEDEVELTNQPQADGSYRMQTELSTVHVMVPEGYDVYIAEDEMVFALSGDYVNSLTYMLNIGMTQQDVEDGFLENVTWAGDEGYYKSHTEVTELNGFRFMGLIYNDDTSSWCAWKELEDCILVLNADVSGETFDMAAMIDSIVPGE